jgi:hypothetical protein
MTQQVLKRKQRGRRLPEDLQKAEQTLVRVTTSSRSTKEAHTKFWSENLKQKDHSEDLAVDGRIKLKWILDKRG